jgi:hypothetical protein
MKNKVLEISKRAWKSKTTQKLLSISSIVITISILGWLIYSQWDLLALQIDKARPQYLGFAFIVYIMILFLTISVWAQIMNSLSHKTPYKIHFIAFCISALGKRLPGTLWYIAWRANIYQDEDHSSKQIIATSGIEMIVIVLAAAIVSIIFAMPMIKQYPYSIIGFVLILIATIILLIPKINTAIFNKLNVDSTKLNFKNVSLWTIQYIVVWLLNGLLLFFIGNILSEFSFSDLGYFIGSLALTGVLSRFFLFLPSNFGFSEVSMSLLLSGIMPSSLAVIIAIINRIIIIIFEIIWALISLGLKTYLEKN